VRRQDLIAIGFRFLKDALARTTRLAGTTSLANVGSSWLMFVSGVRVRRRSRR